MATARPARVPVAALPTSTAPPEIDETIAPVRKLAPKHRAVLVLRYYENMSVEQIAQVMNVRPGTVKSLLHRSLKQLRAQMNGDPND
jgi:DNA-directed RNA polymerase specialized sigma24 family protein